MSETLIQLVDVGFGYPGRPLVLDGVSLDLAAGQRLGLTGPNGCGKSTLLGLIVGLLHPTSGEVRIFGKPRRREAEFIPVRQQVGLVFQDADDQLFCPTVAEDVAFGLLNQGRQRDEVDRVVSETLEAVGLAGFEDRITYRLSGGEKRLVALATVLAMEPRVLLLDEPTAGLDPETTEHLLDRLASLDVAMIVVSHDAATLDRLTDQRVRLT